MSALQRLDRMLRQKEVQLAAALEVLRKLADAAKSPLDDMDKHRCWPEGQERAQDHVPYYYLRCLITEAEVALEGKGEVG